MKEMGIQQVSTKIFLKYTNFYSFVSPYVTVCEEKVMTHFNEQRCRTALVLNLTSSISVNEIFVILVLWGCRRRISLYHVAFSFTGSMEEWGNWGGVPLLPPRGWGSGYTILTPASLRVYLCLHFDFRVWMQFYYAISLAMICIFFNTNLLYNVQSKLRFSTSIKRMPIFYQSRILLGNFNQTDRIVLVCKRKKSNETRILIT